MWEYPTSSGSVTASVPAIWRSCLAATRTPWVPNIVCAIRQHIRVHRADHPVGAADAGPKRIPADADRARWVGQGRAPRDARPDAADRLELSSTVKARDRAHAAVRPDQRAADKAGDPRRVGLCRAGRA